MFSEGLDNAFLTLLAGAFCPRLDAGILCACCHPLNYKTLKRTPKGALLLIVVEAPPSGFSRIPYQTLQNPNTQGFREFWGLGSILLTLHKALNPKPLSNLAKRPKTPYKNRLNPENLNP